MSGAADHFARAEALLAEAGDCEGDSVWRPLLLAQAQVHATLALAAVQADACAVAAASSATAHGVVDARSVVRRMSFAKGAQA